MVEAVPYLLPKNAKEALTLYENIFDAKVSSQMPYSEEMGKQMGFGDDFDYENSTMHSEFEILGARIYMADDNSQDTPGKQIIDVLLEIDTKEQIQTFYENAKENGCKILMELEKTFWGAWYTRFVDPFGIGWQLNFQEEEMQ